MVPVISYLSLDKADKLTRGRVEALSVSHHTTRKHIAPFLVQVLFTSTCGIQGTQLLSEVIVNFPSTFAKQTGAYRWTAPPYLTAEELLSHDDKT